MKTTQTEKTQQVTELAGNNVIMTYEDIDVNVLEYLAISELRSLASKLGISLPMCKTQDELITEIRKTVEREMEYFYSYI